MHPPWFSSFVCIPLFAAVTAPFNFSVICHFFFFFFYPTLKTYCPCWSCVWLFQIKRKKKTKAMQNKEIATGSGTGPRAACCYSVGVCEHLWGKKRSSVQVWLCKSVCVCVCVSWRKGKACMFSLCMHACASSYVNVYWISTCIQHAIWAGYHSLVGWFFMC